MRIDHARRDRRSGEEAEFGGGVRGQSAPQRRPRVDDALADARKPLIRQHAEADAAEVALVPATLVRQIGPFAGDGAGGSGQIPGLRARSGSRSGRRTARPRQTRPACSPAATAASASPFPARSCRRRISAPSWPIALMRSACSSARWSIQTMMSRSACSEGPTGKGAPPSPSTTSEQVASNPMPAIRSGETAACASASFTD